jgi:hypothetical protein
MPKSFLDALSKSDGEAQVKIHYQDGENRLSLIEIKEIPNAKGVFHTHAAGDSISILGGTLYSFSAGPSGCRYLKFNDSADTSFITKDQYQQRK